ncbi:MAG: SPOR domain-containing protein [Candidatus Omnitrophica bacterium]|nr:SPOR domain-containing protein [Candidatus Omnitrophota bacterium]
MSIRFKCAIFAASVFIFMSYSCAGAAVDRSIGRAENAFLQGHYDTAVKEADAVIRGRYGKLDEAYYIKGLSELKLGRFADSRESFGHIKNRYPYSRRLFDAYLGIADSYLLEGEAGKALGVYNEILAKFSNDKNIAIAYYRLNDCYQKLGLKDKAAEYLAMAKNVSPMSLEGGLLSSQGPLSRSVATTVSENRAIAVSQPSVAGGNAAEVFCVQVGSFKSKRNADALAKKLAGYGYEARVVIPVTAQDKLYRVRVGAFDSRQGAESLATRLKSIGYKVRICVEQSCD